MSDVRDKDVDRFNRWAGDYDRGVFQEMFFMPLHQFTLREASIRGPLPVSILDIGCGTGQLLRKAARYLPNARMTGIDAAEEMILVAQAMTPEGAPVRFVHGFAEEMPFADHSFDLVVTTLSFHHWSDQQQALGEVRRVLSPGGTFALVDALAIGLVRRLLLRSHHGRFYQPDTLREMLQTAGFEMRRFAPVPRFAGVVQVVLAAPPDASHRHIAPPRRIAIEHELAGS